LATNPRRNSGSGSSPPTSTPRLRSRCKRRVSWTRTYDAAADRQVGGSAARSPCGRCSKATSQAFEICGGTTVSNQYPLGRYFRSRTLTLMAPGRSHRRDGREEAGRRRHRRATKRRVTPRSSLSRGGTRVRRCRAGSSGGCRRGDRPASR
jgi:hypothetical protein